MREFPNATKRPWSFDDPYIENDVCEVFGGREMREAKAALIVHAVNTYEERERLLDEAAEVLQTIADAHIPDQPVAFAGNELAHAHKHISALRRTARAFLAKLDARDA